ncbi:NADP-dependent oxidoreductase domain-containing protein [Flagelloscypha sp. PMI_526]|nr:NADP-dependent oxidoreductase domain-containing protein [Flagelloscypha sp. PMI_526]
MTTYPTRTLGKQGPQVSAIGFGAMGIGAFYGATDETEAMKTLTYAANNGVTFWDTSDLYGNSQDVLGKWFTETGRRKDIFLATKFGARGGSHPSRIPQCIQDSLKALQTDYIDLYYQHRPDPLVPIEVVMNTLKPYLEDGTIKYIAVSETSVEDIKRVKALGGIVAERLIATQNEFSPFELHLEKTGFVEEMEKLGVGIVVYSPLARGLVTGRYKSPDDFEEGDFRKVHPRFTKENFPKNLSIVEKLKAIADKKSVTVAQVTLAWILAVNPSFVPIPGSRNPDRLEENAKGALISLSSAEVKEIRDLVEAAEVHGGRYAEQHLAPCYRDSLPLDQWKE